MPYYLLRAPRTAERSSEYIHALVRSLVGPQVTNFLVHQSLCQIPVAKTLNLIPETDEQESWLLVDRLANGQVHGCTHWIARQFEVLLIISMA